MMKELVNLEGGCVFLRQRIGENHIGGGTSFQVLHTLQSDKNVSRFEVYILVDWYEKGCRTFYLQLFDLPTSKS